MSAWMHSRKGRIEGEIAWDHGEWVGIELASDHRLSYGSEANRGRLDPGGSILIVRRSLLTPVDDEWLPS